MTDDVKVFEAAARRVLEMDDESVREFWAPLFPEGAADRAMSTVAWLELRRRTWLAADEDERRAMERRDALPAHYDVWKRIECLEKGNTRFADVREHAPYGPVIARLMRKRLMDAGWMPPRAERDP